MLLTLSHRHAAVEHVFSLNDKLLVEKMQEQRLIAQIVIKAHMLSKGHIMCHIMCHITFPLPLKLRTFKIV